MPKKIIYEEHPREYTVLGISVIGDALVGREFKKFIGAHFSEMISVIKSGQYFYIQPEGEWEMIGRSFLRRVEKREVNLGCELDNYKKKIRQYEKLTRMDSRKFSLKTIRQFHKYYRELIGMICVGYSTLDYVEALSKDKKAIYKRWVEKVRLRGENVYKAGEMEFLPRYTEWLSKKYFLDYQPEELLYVFFQEMENFIEKGKKLPEPKILRGRKILFYMRQYPFGKYQLLTGEKAKKEIKRKGLLEKKKRDKKIAAFSGQVAHPGKAVGIAKLIFARKDMEKFQKGDVLVSPMTEPGYLLIMKKAAAIVTDEGGLLCHASIVARELKIPCVIGTKIATKVLRDGDLVEVNADKGVVRILKKK